MGDKALNVLGMIVMVALVTTVVTNKNSKSVIDGLGNAFSGAIRAALGQKK